MATDSGLPKVPSTDNSASPWTAALNQLREWDAAWAEQCVKMTTDPSTDVILPAKIVEFVSVGLNASRTNLDPDGTRRDIPAALAAGASRPEILFDRTC